MSVGTAFHPRTSPLNRKMQWREWSGYFASSVYADFHDIEYNAIREAAALIDVSPLYKYLVTGPGCDAAGRPGDHPRRDEACRRRRRLHAVVRRERQGRRRRDGPSPRRAALPLDGGRSAASLAPPEQQRAGRHDRRGDRGDRRARAPGPAVTRRARGRDRRVIRGPPLLPAPRLEGRAASRSTSPGPATRATSATSCGSRPRAPSAVWDALVEAGACLRDPAGRDGRARRRPARGRADPARGRLHLDPARDEPRAALLAVRDRARPAGQPRQGRFRRAASRSNARCARAVRRAGWWASSSTGTTSRGCTTPRACHRRSARPWTARRSLSSPGAARSAARRATAGARSSSRRSRSRRCRRSTRRPAASCRSNGRWRADAGGSTATVVGPAVPGPGAQARLSPRRSLGGAAVMAGRRAGRRRRARPGTRPAARAGAGRRPSAGRSLPQSSDSSVVLIPARTFSSDRLVGAQRPVDHDRDLFRAVGRSFDRRQLGRVTRVADGDPARALWTRSARRSVSSFCSSACLSKRRCSW